MSKNTNKSKTASEVPDFVLRQRAEAQAKLDALLATVTVKDRSTYERLPKKVGEIVVDTGLKDGHREQKATFALRLERSGQFVVEHADVIYSAKTREALQAKMEQVGRIVLSAAWRRYIEIEYEADTGRELRWGSGRIGVDERRTKKTRVHGVSLKWQVVDYTDEFEVPGQGARRMRRAVSDEGVPSETTDTVDGLPDGLVEHTEERLAVLRTIVDGLTAVDAKMVQLFRGRAREIAGRLDAAVGLQLMLSTEATGESTNGDE